MDMVCSYWNMSIGIGFVYLQKCIFLDMIHHFQISKILLLRFLDNVVDNKPC